MRVGPGCLRALLAGRRLHHGARLVRRHCDGLASLQLPERRRHSSGRLSACVAASVDFYEALQLPRAATKAQVKAAYRTAVRSCHPDIDASAAAAARFQLVSDAYSVLVDDGLRRLYDNLGVPGLGERFARYLRKGHRYAGAPERGRDVHAVVGLEFREAVLGTERVVTTAVLEGCHGCGGLGVAPGSRADACGVCRGSGEVMMARRVRGDRVASLGVCPACGGSGSEVKEYCGCCGGDGRARVQRGIKVRIPAGVDVGSVLRLAGCGDCGRRGGGRGDVYLTFQVHAMEGVRRQGLDLYSRLQVPYTDAILGGALMVPTMRGEAALAIPPGTQHGATLALPRAGVSPVGGGDGGEDARGAHYFQVDLQLPRNVHDGERALLEQLQLLNLSAEQARQQVGNGATPTCKAAE